MRTRPLLLAPLKFVVGCVLAIVILLVLCIGVAISAWNSRHTP